MTPLLEAVEAAFHYPARSNAVGAFSITVCDAELHHVRGPSGCGKSTFARMLTGLIPHLYHGTFSGEVRVGGECTTQTSLWQLSTRVGLVGQNPAAQLLAATVRDEILFGLENLGLSRAEMKTRLAAALDNFGLRGLEARDPRTLSGGEQQKLVLAAILVRRPDVIVLDEAFSMLDAAAATDVAAVLQRMRASGTAVVAFEHRLPAGEWQRDARRQVLASEPAVQSSLPEWPRHVAPFEIRVSGLDVTLGRRSVLEDIDLSLSGGRVIALLGANGAGKTTLLRVLAGLQPYSGDIRDDGVGLLGLCFQNPDQQIFNPTVRQEILFGNAGIDEGLYRCALELFGLAPYEYTPPLLLSEGEKKRLALAILLMRAGLRGLCLDEPTLGQDDRHRSMIGRVVRHLAAAGYLCVVATHDLEWATEWCDQFVLLHEGRIAGHQDARALGISEPKEEQCHVAV